MRIVIDTCVIMDFATGRDEHLMEISNILLAESIKGTFEAFITANTVTDLFYLLHKSCSNRNQTIEYLEQLFGFVSILDVNQQDCINALSSKINDYEDAVLAESAFRNNADYIITDNLKDFSNSKVKIISGKQFLEQIFGSGQ